MHDEDFLNGGVFCVIKRVIFFVVCAFILFVGYKELSYGVARYSVFFAAGVFSYIFSSLLIYAGYVFWYPAYGYQKKRLFLFYPLSLVGGYLLGLLFAFLDPIFPDFELSYFVSVGACVIFVIGIICCFRFDFCDPFYELGEMPPDMKEMTAYFESDEFNTSMEIGREWDKRERERRNPNGRCCYECKSFYLDDDLKGHCYACGRVNPNKKACSDFDPN